MRYDPAQVYATVEHGPCCRVVWEHDLTYEPQGFHGRSQGAAGTGAALAEAHALDNGELLALTAWVEVRDDPTAPWEPRGDCRDGIVLEPRTETLRAYAVVYFDLPR